MASLSSHANVYNVCLRLLRQRGYRLWVEGPRDKDGVIDPGSVAWKAEKDGFDFHADNPIELLGLVALYEEKQPSADLPYWWVIDGSNIWEELLDDCISQDDE